MNGSLESPLTGTDEHSIILTRTQETASSLAARAKALRIMDGASRAAAADLRARITSGLKRVDDARIQIVKPLNDHVANINARFRPLREDLEAARATVDAEIRRDHQEQERIARVAREKAEAEAGEAQKKADEEQRARAAEIEAAARDAAKAAGMTEPEAAELGKLYAGDELAKPAPAVAVPVIIAPPKTVRTETGASVTVKKVWKFDITDEAAVPREFFVIDPDLIEARMRSALKATDRPPEIPGVRFYQDTLVAGGRR
jgi:hypothetical protein